MMTGGSKLLFSLIRKNWSTQLLLFVMAGLSLALAFPAPFLIRFLLDEGLTFLSRDKIHLAFVAILLCAFLTSGLSYLENKLFVDYSQRFYQEFKEMLLAHWLTISPMNFHKYHSGYVANRFIHEIQGVISFFIRLFNKFIIDILSLSVSLLILFWLSWKLALISLVGLPLLWFLLQYMQIRIQNANELAYEQQALLGKNLQDLLQGIWAILSIQAQSWALTKYHSTNDSVRLHQTRLSLLESTFTLLASLVVTVIPLG
ncbi:MAG: ABC transporter ATP-binding protein, partial [Candidatus Margulisiibacteriota bacterium]